MWVVANSISNIVPGVFSTWESEPRRASLQIRCCYQLCNFRLCKYLGPWPCLPNLWGNGFFFWVDPWYSLLQCSNICIWEAQKGAYLDLHIALHLTNTHMFCMLRYMITIVYHPVLLPADVLWSLVRMHVTAIPAFLPHPSE